MRTASKLNHCPRSANLLIGEFRENQGANREIGVPRWHSRGYVPHFENTEVIQYVTFHLGDSLPQAVLSQLESELKDFPAGKRDVERRKRVDAWIDAGHGSCILRNPALAQMAQNSLLRFDSERYRLLAWVVMPNHVHVLFEPIQGWTVAKIVAAWKKFMARKICDAANQEKGILVQENRYPANQEIGVPRSGAPVWHREYWDRYIRDEGHFENVVRYIHMNPVKAGLVSVPQKWRWSSAYTENDGRPSSNF